MLIKEIVITGSRGVIGSVLISGLSGFKITSLNLPDVDVRQYEQLLSYFKGKTTIIHLAKNRDRVEENSRDDIYDPDDSLMTYNVYKAALEAKVKRVIMASSVHADNFYQWKGLGKLSIDRIPTPNSPYGANKVFMEALGRYYAKKGLEVICVRFGGVNPANKSPENNYWENAVWLSHKDCLAMIKACLKAEKVPNNFAVFYAVSNSKDRVHDTNNPFGWKPV